MHAQDFPSDISVPRRSLARRFIPARKPNASSEGLSQVFEGAPTRRIPAKSKICFEGDERSSVYRIVDGLALTYRFGASGRRIVNGLLHPGDLIGFESGDTYRVCADAATDCVIESVRTAVLERRLATEPALSRQLLQVATARLSDADELLFLRSRRFSYQRLAKLIVDCVRRSGRAIAGKPTVNLAMSRTDIANLLNVSVETASRGFTRLREMGLIALPTATQVVVSDLSALERVAAAESHERAA